MGTIEDSAAIKAIDTSIDPDPHRAELIDAALDQGTVQVALDDLEVVGYSVVNRSFFHRPFLEMLMVAPSRRGGGIGRKLLREALRNVGAAGELWTSTNESNARMQSLLESEGFELTGRVENLDPGDPELFYFKRVSG